MVKLLQRFYLPTGGAVRLDGRDLGLYSPKWLKRHVGLVAQEPTLYSRSIYRSACSRLVLWPSQDGLTCLPAGVCERTPIVTRVSGSRG